MEYESRFHTLVRGRVGARVRGRVGGVRVRAGVRGGGVGVGVEVAHLDRLIVGAREEEAPCLGLGRGKGFGAGG